MRARNGNSVQIGTDSLEVPRSDLAGSDSVLVRVTVNDGFDQASDDSNGAFSIPDHPPTVTIATPGESLQFRAGQLIDCQAIAFDPEDGPLTGASLQWTSDIDGPLGQGEFLEVPASGLTPGLHRVTLVGTDSNGGQGTAERMVLVEDTKALIEVFSDSFEGG